MKPTTKIAALVIALAMALALVACGGNADSSAGNADGSVSASASDDGASSAATSPESDADASDAAVSQEGDDDANPAADPETTGELMGKPWVTTIFQGNLPAEQPEAKDDLYTHYNYEYLASHQEQPSMKAVEYGSELQETNLTVIEDTSKTSHDLEQLRIFYEQASDAEELQKRGLSDVQPYLDRIDAVTSIEEMNELLTAEDFPFSPFVMTYITLSDTRDVNIVNVHANLAFVDPIMEGGVYYQDSDDPQAQESMEAAIQNVALSSFIDLRVAGMTEDETAEAMSKILEFERAHGKYCEYSGMYATQDFGAMADATRESFFTLDELCAACPNYPMKETLDKLGKGASPCYVASPKWLDAFNGLWTPENLEAIKLTAKLKVLDETRPYRDPTAMNQLREEAGQSTLDAESFAYEACNQQDTFAIVLAETYVDEALGPNAKPRLTELSQRLVDKYKELVDSTGWLSEESQQRVIEKLDNMTLNVLEPTGGYYDFSGLELTPTDEGGTLFENYLKLRQYRLDQESKMVGQPAVAACPWFTVRPTEMNAFYDPVSNSINIYPGFVTSLLYTDDMSDLELISKAGFTISHEISHGFDYEGAQFDAYGTPNPVFADADADAFVLKCSTLALYYNGLEVEPGVTVNGERVVTEAAADLSGMQAILELAGEAEDVDYDEFFANASSMWAEVLPETLLPNLLLDAHPFVNHRVNVNAQMFDPIYDELGVAEGDGMYLAPEERINIWGPNA